MTMNIVASGDAEEHLAENVQNENGTNLKEKLQNKDTQNKSLDEKSEKDNGSVDKKATMNGTDDTSNSNGSSETEKDESETNGSCEEQGSDEKSDGDKKEKLTLVLNVKNHEIKNGDKSEETTEDSVSEKSFSDNETEEDEKIEKPDSDETTTNNTDDEENEGKVDEKKNIIGDSDTGAEENKEDSEQDEEEQDEEKDEKSSEVDIVKEKTVNGTDDDDDEEDDDDDKVTGIELDEEATPEFDNKYDGKTSQLPNFAVVCSFFNVFGALMDMPNVTLPEFEESIDTTKEFSGKKGEAGLLELLHIKLFRKLAKSSRFSGMSNCAPERLKKIVLKFCKAMNLEFAWDLEESGYQILTSNQKLTILKTLCEVQFDDNPKFRADYTELYKADPTVLRLAPFGYEQDGCYVWVHEDTECNIHVYSVEQDDTDGSTWRIRVGCLDDMSTYISKLKIQTEVNPKDVSANKFKEKRIAREEERQRKKAERDLRRQEEEEKRSKKKGRSNRRGARGKKKEDDPPSPIPISDTSDEEEDDGCIGCFENKDTDVVLLCDGCDAAYHTLCLRPPVMVIPDDDWFCPFCLQVQLVQKLELKYIEIKNKLKKKERKAKRWDFYGIRSDNIVDGPEGRRTGRAAAKRVDYNFTDYDQMISEGISSYKKGPPSSQGRQERLEGRDATNDGDRSTRTRRNVDTPAQEKRKYADLDDSGEEYAESDGSEYVHSSSDEVKYKKNMKNFIVNDDIDEIEERYSRSKRQRRSGHRNNRSSGTRRSSRTKKRRKYEDDSDFGDESDESDKSSDEGNPRSRLRDRKAAAAVYNYNEEFSDEEEVVKEKEADDGGEWANDNEDEEVIEEMDTDEVSSGSGSEKEERRRRAPPPKSPPRKVRAARGKKKRYVVSDDESDEEVPFDDHESGDEKNGRKKKKVIDDESEEEEEEEEVEDKVEEEMEEEGSEEEEEEEEEDDTKKPWKAASAKVDDDESEEIEEETDAEEEEEEKEKVDSSEVNGDREDVMSEIKDESLLKSSALPPCFSASLPDGSSPSKPALDDFSSEKPDIKPDPIDTNIFRSSETESFSAGEFWKELNDNIATNVAENGTNNADKKPDITQIAGNGMSSLQKSSSESSNGNKESPMLHCTESPDIKPQIPGSDGLSHPGAPTSFSSVPPPPYLPGFSPAPAAARMATPVLPLSPRGPMHPQHRLRAMMAAQPRMPPSALDMRYPSGPVPHHPQAGPHHPQAGPRHPHASLHAMQPGTGVPRQMHMSPHHQQPGHPPRHHMPGTRQQLIPPGSRPMRPARMETGPHKPAESNLHGMGPNHSRHMAPGGVRPHPVLRAPIPSRPSLPNHPASRLTAPTSSHASIDSLSLPRNHASPSRAPVQRHPASLPGPTHPSMRLPTHPSARLRAPTAGPTSAQSPGPVRPDPNYPYAPSQPGMRGAQSDWRGDRPPYEPYYRQYQRPPAASFYGAPQSQQWPRSQHPSPGGYEGYERMKQQPQQGMGGEQHSPSGNGSDTKAQTQEYKEHMKQLKEYAKQEKEMKRLEKIREKELKQKQKRPYSPPQPNPLNTSTGNMNYFKSMVIGGSSGNGESDNDMAASNNGPYSPFKSSRM